jgi:hypothetical protein
VSADQQDLREPYCTFASPGEPHDITVVGYSPAHYESVPMPTWQSPSTTRQQYVGPIAHFRCGTCGRTGRVDVGKDWVPPDGVQLM